MSNTNTTQRTYKIVGSKGDLYEVVNPNDGTSPWTCTCPHYTHRQTECKHIREVKQKNEEDDFNLL